MSLNQRGRNRPCFVRRVGFKAMMRRDSVRHADRNCRQRPRPVKSRLLRGRLPRLVLAPSTEGRETRNVGIGDEPYPKAESSTENDRRHSGLSSGSASNISPPQSSKIMDRFTVDDALGGDWAGAAVGAILAWGGGLAWRDCGCGLRLITRLGSQALARACLTDSAVAARQGIGYEPYSASD